MITVSLLLIVAALAVLVASQMGKAPLWIALLLVIIERLLAVLTVFPRGGMN